MSGVISASVAGAGLVSGYLGAEASRDAANISSDAQMYAADLQQQQYEQTRQDLAPYREAGVRNLNLLDTYGRSRVSPGEYIPQSNLPEFDPSQIDLNQDPSYRFRVDEAMRQIDRVSAGQGNLLSGNRLEEVIGRSQDIASQEYGNVYQRALQRYTADVGREGEQRRRGVEDFSLAYGQEQDYLNYLRNLAGTGQAATSQTAQIGANAAANIGQNIVGAGNAQAAGQIGVANAYQNTLGSFGTAAALYGAGTNPYVGSEGAGTYYSSGGINTYISPTTHSLG